MLRRSVQGGGVGLGGGGVRVDVKAELKFFVKIQKTRGPRVL